VIIRIHREKRKRGNTQKTEWRKISASCSKWNAKIKCITLMWGMMSKQSFYVSWSRGDNLCHANCWCLSQNCY